MESPNGRSLRWFLSEMNAAAVSTFWGAGHTWASTRGCTSRNDYLGVPDDKLGAVTRCDVRRESELSEGKHDDHSTVVASLQLNQGRPDATGDCASVQKSAVKRSVKLDKAKLEDPALREQFQHHIWQFQFPREAVLEDDEAQDSFPAIYRKP